MAKLQRVEEQLELKCHADKLFDIWTSKAHLMPKISPNKVAKVELVEGEWNTIGALYNWTYRINANGETILISGKTKTEELDKENRSFTYSMIEGHIMQNYYKNFKVNMEVSPMGDNQGCVMKLSFEYEKLYEGAPEPNMLTDLAFHVAKDMEAHLCSA